MEMNQMGSSSQTFDVNLCEAGFEIYSKVIARIAENQPAEYEYKDFYQHRIDCKTCTVKGLKENDVT
jgi:hypothetical protein